MQQKYSHEMQVLILTVEKIYEMPRKLDPKLDTKIDDGVINGEMTKIQFPISESGSLQTFENLLRGDANYKK